MASSESIAMSRFFLFCNWLKKSMGDSMVAGIIAALSEGGDLERAARLGTAFAAARVDADFEGSLRDHGAIEAIASSVELKSIGL